MKITMIASDSKNGKIYIIQNSSFHHLSRGSYIKSIILVNCKKEETNRKKSKKIFIIKVFNSLTLKTEIYLIFLKKLISTETKHPYYFRIVVLAANFLLNGNLSWIPRLLHFANLESSNSKFWNQISFIRKHSHHRERMKLLEERIETKEIEEQ